MRPPITCNSINKPHSVFGRAVCLSLHPGRLLLFPFVHWFHKHYKGKYRFERIIFSLDLLLIGAAITLATISIFLFIFPPHTFEDDILFEAHVAPREIVTGAPSTLIIRYTNNTEETLQDAKLSLTFPAHFLLQSVSVNGSKEDQETTAIELGDIVARNGGVIHVTGVMFGDVHGKQTFQSSMTFAHGNEKIVPGKKLSSYTFSPSRSTLELSLELPDRVMASQPMSGKIHYKNTGVIDFPEITIEPEWPEGFQGGKTFRVPRINAGQSGSIPLSGFLRDVPEQIEFIFHPYFTFGEDRYRQDTLRQTVSVLPAQIKISHEMDQTNLRPGSSAIATITYKHVGTETLHDVEIGITSNNAFIGKTEITKLTEIKPGDEKTIAITLPILSHVNANNLTSLEQIQITTQTFARYTLASDRAERITTVGSETISKLTTPMVFESFARYMTPSGDQIGRGPLPPRVGQKTSYWIFWNVDGTTNTLNHVSIEGTLPANVTFSGKETASENGGVSFDPETRKISWNVESIPPTLNPGSKMYSVAFEVVLVPSALQIGTSPTLMNEIHLTGTDSFTGEFISASSTSLSTILINDKMASAQSIVKK